MYVVAPRLDGGGVGDGREESDDDDDPNRHCFLSSTETFEKHLRKHLTLSSSADAADGRRTRSDVNGSLDSLAPARGATKAVKAAARV